MKSRGGRGAVAWAAGGLLLLALGGCGRKIIRLHDQGHHASAVAAADDAWFAPKGRAARALAASLVEQGNPARARATLLADFRHGGDLVSLVALADLERSLGLVGIAALHYGRAADLSRDSLEDRTDVCRLLLARATVWAGDGAGLAAEQDLDRVHSLCGTPKDAGQAADIARLRARIDRVAQAEVDARVARTECTHDCVSVDATAAADDLAAELDEARHRGPVGLREVSQRGGLQLSASDLITVLSADLEAQAGLEILTDDQVRTMVGEQSWSDLAPSVMTQTDAVAAYLQLRLAAVMPDVPVVLRSRTGPGELDVWLAKALEVTDDHGWRVLAWAGDLTGAELALGTVWRPRPRKATPVEPTTTTTEPSSTEPSPTQAVAPAAPVEPPVVDGVVAPAHWTARVVPTEANIDALLLEGRLRHAAGQDRRALEIHRYLAVRMLAAGLPRADARIAQQAAWHLAHGRPWQALALADLSPQPQAQRVASAAATALRLTDAFCGGPCVDDRDRMLAGRVVGEDWVRTQQQQRVARSRVRGRPTPSVDACPTLGELLASDAQGRLPVALATALHDPQAAGQGQRLREAIEADLGLSCAGRYVVPLMRVGGHQTSASDLAENLAHDAALAAPRALAMHANLAMVGGRAKQAELLAIAAGAVSTEPAFTWRSLATAAHANDLRELTLRSLREALLHTPGLDDGDVQRAMVIAALSGIDSDWNLRETPAGRDEPAAHVHDLIARAEPSRRWNTREMLARSLAQQSWFDADAGQRLGPALWPQPDIERAHPVARAWLEVASGGVPDLQPADVGPLDLASLELLITLRQQARMPLATEVFVAPERLESVRLAVARHSRTWVVRWRTAIGLCVYGRPAIRARAMTALLEMADGGSESALRRIAIEDPTAIESASDGGLQEAALLATPEDQLSVVFELPPDPLGL